MDRYDPTYLSQFKSKGFNMRISEIDSKSPRFNELRNGELKGKEVDRDYAWCLNYMVLTNKLENIFICEDQIENENKDEDEDVCVDENDKDPEYLLFLENLTEHGKSYKLKVSNNNEEPCFVYYEEEGDSDWCDDFQTYTDDNSGDEVTASEDMLMTQKAKTRPNENKGGSCTKKEVCRRKKMNDPCYKMFLTGAYTAVKCKEEEEPVEYEKNVTTSDSDSDVVILDNVQNCSEGKNKQLVLVENEPSLREKLMHILKLPYNEKEYEELSEYIEQEKPVCRLLALRGRAVSSALSGVKRSALDYGPERFRSMLNAAQNDPPKALNLLRIFRFWLEHLPNKDAFQPWKDKDILKVRPSEKNA